MIDGRHIPLPEAPHPPKTPMALACSVGSGKRWTMRLSAEGMVRAPAAEGMDDQCEGKNEKQVSHPFHSELEGRGVLFFDERNPRRGKERRGLKYQ